MHVRNNVFLEHCAKAYDVMMSLHCPPHPSDECRSCFLRCNIRKPLNGPEPRYRCQDCLQHPDLCLQCINDMHVFNPTHTLWKWDEEERKCWRSVWRSGPAWPADVGVQSSRRRPKGRTGSGGRKAPRGRKIDERERVHSTPLSILVFRSYRVFRRRST